MTDRKPDVFFEAMLEALRGNGADVPAPNWNYEKTLVEILAELKNQNPPMDGVVISGETVYPPNVLNLYDPDDPHGDTSYMPEYATYNGGEITLSNDFDASPYYDRLKRGMPVWIRMPYESYGTVVPEYIQIIEWHLTDDYAGLGMGTREYYIYTENYRPETETEETPNINPLI